MAPNNLSYTHTETQKSHVPAFISTSFIQGIYLYKALNSYILKSFTVLGNYLHQVSFNNCLVSALKTTALCCHFGLLSQLWVFQVRGLMTHLDTLMCGQGEGLVPCRLGSRSLPALVMVSEVGWLAVRSSEACPVCEPYEGPQRWVCGAPWDGCTVGGCVSVHEAHGSNSHRGGQ